MIVEEDILNVGFEKIDSAICQKYKKGDFVIQYVTTGLYFLEPADVIPGTFGVKGESIRSVDELYNAISK